MHHDKVYGLHYIKHGVKASQCFNQWSEKVNYLRDINLLAVFMVKKWES